jgi:hypothetical protein
VAAEYKDGMNAVIANPIMKHFCVIGSILSKRRGKGNKKGRGQKRKKKTRG